METTPTALTRLAAAYERHLFDHELRRLSHHMALVASENWLGVELAMVVNELADEIGLPGWSAIVQKELVDVALVPPGSIFRLDKNPENAISFELKLVAAEYWPDHWRDVRVDLAGKTDKPRPDLAVCFLVNHLKPRNLRWQKGTPENYAAFHSRIPTEPGEFEPVPDEPWLHVHHTSAEHTLEWPHQVFGSWRNGYKATMRILWVTQCGKTSRLHAMLRPQVEGEAGRIPG